MEKRFAGTSIKSNAKPTRTKQSAVFGAIGFPPTWVGKSSKSTLVGQFAPTARSFRLPIKMTNDAKARAPRKHEGERTGSRSNVSAAAVTIKVTAVTGFIAINPGKTRFSNSVAVSQPIRARTLTVVAKAAATPGISLSAAGNGPRAASESELLFM